MILVFAILSYFSLYCLVFTIQYGSQETWHVCQAVSFEGTGKVFYGQETH